MKRTTLVIIVCLCAVIAVAAGFYACSGSHKTRSVASVGPVLSVPAGWLELPVGGAENCILVTHWSEIGDTMRRNYTVCYDTCIGISRWVAYPLHPLYCGDAPRRDRWTFDPQVEKHLQTDISRRGFGEGFDRGHQLPSGDRTATKTANAQTFYPTNATAQRSSFNRGVWNALEGRIRERMTLDTMYVVTGAVLNAIGEDKPVLRSENGSAIPNYYYKVVLYQNGGEWHAAGFWLDHHGEYANGLTTEHCLTVRRIEALTGLDFFPEMPRQLQDRIETVLRPEDWAL